MSKDFLNFVVEDFLEKIGNNQECFLMNDIIRLLPDSVANQIAAGEVIQRPSSVIKELVENSIDAGAKKIDIIVKDAGRTLLQVIDDGCGMSSTDARLAFERHSTSKIKTAADLFTLRTMGFRGEALASIAAISQVDIRTMRPEDSVGTRLKINGSKVESQEPDVTIPGTNMSIKNLFFNVPARRKFLKKDTIEFTNILHEFERMALVNPGVELSLTHNERLVHRLGRSTLKERIGNLFGRTIEDQLIPVSAMTEPVRISGFIGNPTHARKRGALQYFFVNGRNMRHPYFHRAVMSCYEKLLPPDTQPNYFIDFTVDPETIDVNIHPTKNEIKFENEQIIWQLLVAAVRESLGKFNVGPSIDFEMGHNFMIGSLGEVSRTEKEIAETESVRISVSPQTLSKPALNHSVTSRQSFERPRQNKDWETLYQDNQKEITRSSKFIQIKDRYILTPSMTGLTIIDQHEAHINVLYHKFYNLYKEHSFTSQSLIFPVKVSLSPDQMIMLDSVQDILEEIGYRIENAEQNEKELTALPSVLGNAYGAEVLLDILDGLQTEASQENDVFNVIPGIIAMSMARGSAIRAGQSLTSEEIETLIGSLYSLSSPALSPDGKKVITEIDVETIEKLFRV